MQKIYSALCILLAILVFNTYASAQTIECDATDLQDFYNLYGGSNAFSTHTTEAINTFIQTEDAIEAGNYTQANTLVSNLFNTYPKGDNVWWSVFNDPNGANLGTPHAYYGLRMMEDIIDYHLNGTPPVNPKTAKMKIVLVGCSHGIQPTTDAELLNGTGPFVTNNLQPALTANNYCAIRQSFDLFSKYITAITKGKLMVEVEFIELPSLCMDVSVSTTQPYFATGSIQPVWDTLNDSIEEKTDWWWVVYPSHVPDFPTFDDESFITGGMGQDSKGGPVFIIDDKWMTRKPAHLGSGVYNDIERRIYLPQWLQHEFYHHLFRIYPEFTLEVNGHDWFDRSTWPADFVGQFETDYYSESLHKRLQTACVSLENKLITRKRDDLQVYYDDLVMEDLVGDYSLDNIQNAWHVGEILKIGSTYFWKNSANVQWSVTPNFATGKLETGPDCPYPGQDFFIEFYQNSEGDFVPGTSGLRFQGDFYKRRFDLIRDLAPLEIVLDLYENKCLDSLVDSGNIVKQNGEPYWQNNIGALWSLTPDLDNEHFTLDTDSPTPGEQFDLVIVENDCGIAPLGFKYLNQYYWRPKREEQNPSPTLVNPIVDLQLADSFGTHQIDLTNVFDDIDGEALFLFATSSDSSIISTEIIGQQLTLTGHQSGEVTILVMALDFNGGLVMNKFYINKDASVSIDSELTEANITIFPSLTTDYVNINGEASEYQISLYSINHELLKDVSRSGPEIQLDLRDLAKGMYVVVVTDSKTRKVKIEKIMKF